MHGFLLAASPMPRVALWPGSLGRVPKLPLLWTVFSAYQVYVINMMFTHTWGRGIARRVPLCLRIQSALFVLGPRRP